MINRVEQHLYAILTVKPFVNLPWLAHAIGKQVGYRGDAHTLRRKIERILRRWQDYGMVQTWKQDGFIYAQAKPEFFTNQRSLLVDLSKNLQNSKPSEGSKTAAKILKIPKRHREWVASQWLKRYSKLNKTGWQVLESNFGTYLEDVNNKKLLFVHQDDKEKWLILPYSHRFKKKALKRKLAEYGAIWDQAARYRVGVHLTVTFGENKTIGEINEQLCKLFNHLMSWIKWRRTKTLDQYAAQGRLRYETYPQVAYLKVLEFQDSGRHHLHVLIFGMGRIADKITELTPQLERIGFGPINYVYKMVKHGNQWLWAKEKPADALANTPKDHFKKYLSKAFELHHKTAMYWLTNKRFFTCSMNLITSNTDGEIELSQWIFIGVFDWSTIPDFLFHNIKHPPDLQQDKPITVEVTT